jgi:hypothetical protein
LDEQEKDGLPGRGLLHRQAEQQSQQRRRSLVLWNEVVAQTGPKAGASIGRWDNTFQTFQKRL